MKIIRKSPVTGIETTWDIDVTEEQIQAWENGTLIQYAMSHLSADEREFIMTGITPEDWDILFPEEDEE